MEIESNDSHVKDLKSSIADAKTVEDLVPFIKQLYSLDDLKHVLHTKADTTDTQQCLQTSKPKTKEVSQPISAAAEPKELSIDELLPTDLTKKWIEYVAPSDLRQLPVLSKTFYNFVYNYNCVANKFPQWLPNYTGVVTKSDEMQIHHAWQQVHISLQHFRSLMIAPTPKKSKKSKKKCAKSAESTVQAIYESKSNDTDQTFTLATKKWSQDPICLQSVCNQFTKWVFDVKQDSNCQPLYHSNDKFGSNIKQLTIDDFPTYYGRQLIGTSKLRLDHLCINNSFVSSLVHENKHGCATNASIIKIISPIIDVSMLRILELDVSENSDCGDCGDAVENECPYDCDTCARWASEPTPDEGDFVSFGYSSVDDLFRLMNESSDDENGLNLDVLILRGDIPYDLFRIRQDYADTVVIPKCKNLRVLCIENVVYNIDLSLNKNISYLKIYNITKEQLQLIGGNNSVCNVEFLRIENTQYDKDIKYNKFDNAGFNAKYFYHGYSIPPKRKNCGKYKHASRCGSQITDKTDFDRMVTNKLSQCGGYSAWKHRI